MPRRKSIPTNGKPPKPPTKGKPSLVQKDNEKTMSNNGVEKSLFSRHIVRVSVLGLAGITVNNTRKTEFDPTDLKALVSFSRDQNVKGTSIPSLLLSRASIGSDDNIETQSSGEIEIAPSEEPSCDRYIAVWDDIRGEQAVSFETTLHPSTSTNKNVQKKNQNNNAEVSSAFVPKSFEVTIALGDEKSKKPTFLIGVATMAISGDECLAEPGVPKILDLPVLNLRQARPVGMHHTITPEPWYSVENPSTVREIKVESPEEMISDNETVKQNNTVEKKKKKGFGRLFSKKKKASVPATTPQQTKTEPKKKIEPLTYSDMICIDPSDAVLRVSVEIFEKGSELQKIFDHRRKNYIENASSLEFAISRSSPLVDAFSDDDASDNENNAEMDNISGITPTIQASEELDSHEGCTNPLTRQLSKSLSKRSKSYRKSRPVSAIMGACVSGVLDEDIGRCSTKSKKISDSSPRSVNDFGRHSYDSGSRSSCSRSGTQDETYNDETLDGTSYSASYSGSHSIIQTMKDVLQCRNPHFEEEELIARYQDHDRLPPDYILSVDEDDESVGDLTATTFERQYVRTKDLVPKVDPKIALANRGKALVGRVLLPTAFGGDGLCVSHGTRLFVRGPTDNTKEKQKQNEDYERILFRQEKELDPIVAHRVNRALGDEDENEEEDPKSYPDSPKQGYKPVVTKSSLKSKTKYSSPVTAVYEVPNNYPIEPNLTCDEEIAGASADDRYGLSA